MNHDESAPLPAAPASAPADLQPRLDAVEARVLACLVEKAAITPEVYPLTLNAAVAACNQKTSREPVMQLEAGAVAHALRTLEAKKLAGVAHASTRALRYEHHFDSVYGTTARQRAVLCVMLLRGPQTLAELLNRSERIAAFPGLDDVRDTLERLSRREPALVTCIGRAPGQREDRYMHLLCGPIDAGTLAAAAASTSAPSSTVSRADLQERVERLEAEVDSLRAELAALRERLDDRSPPT